MIIEAKIIYGHWPQVSIVHIEMGYSQRLLNGVWVNVENEAVPHVTELLKFGKYFENESKAEKFIESKAFKSILKNIEKNYKDLI